VAVAVLAVVAKAVTKAHLESLELLIQVVAVVVATTIITVFLHQETAVLAL
jgi:hypothetical protein